MHVLIILHIVVLVWPIMNTKIWYLLFLTVGGAIVARLSKGLRYPAFIAELNGLRCLMLTSMMALIGSCQVVHLCRICLRLNRTHSLTKWNRYNLTIANILEQNLRITNYQRIRNIQLILQLITTTHTSMNIHAILKVLLLLLMQQKLLLLILHRKSIRVHLISILRKLFYFGANIRWIWNWQLRFLAWPVWIQQLLLLNFDSAILEVAANLILLPVLLLLIWWQSIDGHRIIIVYARIRTNVLPRNFLCIRSCLD